jgi:hypothetical protein
MQTPDTPYDQDFYVWTQTQAALMRQEKWQEVDWEHVAEEIEALGKRDRRELASRLQVLVMHLLQWQYQPEHHSGSWRRTIGEQRDQLHLLLEDSPSLRPQVPALLARRYPYARDKALEETGLFTLPETCPFTPEQVLDVNFWPEG